MKRITFARLAVVMLAVAGLALQGCGGDDDGGISAADQARIDTLEQIVEELQEMEPEPGPEGPAGPEGPTGPEGPPATATSASERIMMSLGGTAPTGSKADVAKMQGDIIKGLKGTASPAAWYNARSIIAVDNKGMPLGVVEDAMRLHGRDVGAELADRTTRANPGPDGRLNDVPGTGEGGYDMALLLDGLNARRSGNDQLSAQYDIDNLPEIMDEGDTNAADIIFTVIQDSRIDNPLFDPETAEGDFGGTNPRQIASPNMVTWENVQDAARDVLDWEFDISFLIANFLDLDVTDEDNGFTTQELRQFLTNDTGATATTEITTTSVAFAGDIGPNTGITDADDASAISRYILDFLVGAIGNDDTYMGTPGTPGVAGSRDNYPSGADGSHMIPRTHLDTLTLVPVMDVDGVSLVKYSIDSAIGTTGTPPVPIKDGYYRMEAYGAWLEDSYFAVHIYSALTNYGRGNLVPATHGKTTAVHFAGGHPASLAGLNENAMWTGAMVGHDTKSTADDTRVQGNAMLTARIQTDTLADPGPGGVAVMDVMFDNITDAEGMDARVTELSWTGLELSDRSGTTPAGFIKSNGEIEGWLFNDGNEVVGKFNHMDIVGAYGATLDMMDDMASQ